LRGVIGKRHRWHAVRGYLHELDGDLPAAATAYAEAARRATSVAERDHLVRQAARTRAVLADRQRQLRRERQLSRDLRPLARPAVDANPAAKRFDAVHEADEPGAAGGIHSANAIVANG
jgi:hypothetical protein